MKKTSALSLTRLHPKRIALCAFLALTAPLAVTAQQTVFNDTFGSSTLNGVSIPSGTPTASSTVYEILSSKNATGTTIAPGHFSLITAATSSGNSEAQAVFTKYPVTLASIGDYIELDYTFTDTTNILNNLNGNSCGLYCGLFNSGDVPPQSGTILWNSGYSSSLTTADTGGTIGWVGYNAAMLYGQTAASSWTISTRPVQTAANNMNQGLLYNYPQGGSGHSASPGVYPFPNLTIGSQYTAQLRITLSAAGTLTVSNAMYAGVGVGGTMVFSNFNSYTGANFLTTNFDGLAIGYRAGAPTAWTNDINSITVIAGLAAQAGPYYTMTSSGDGCGGAQIGLGGSVTTNIYWLYNSGTNTGVSLDGNGSALDFGFQSVSGVYTVIASNIVTGSTGPMLGSVTISSQAAAIAIQPTSVTCVTNLTASFSVVATGASLTYQWYKGGTALANGGDVSGVTTSNLVISPAQAADAATSVNGYYVVVQDPCGNIVTSSPPAALTLTPPPNLVWQGGNPNNNWDYTDLNFTLSGSPQAFTDGADVTFDDSSANQTVTLTTNVIPSLVSVTGTKSYSFYGTGAITKIAQLIDSSSGTLTIANSENYTGGTSISNGATLSIGDGTSASGSLGGTVFVSSGGTLNYNFNNTAGGTINIINTFAGNGTVNCYDAAGSTLQTATTSISSNFNGTINVVGYTSLHASDGNAGYNLGNGSTINVPDNAQVWLDRSSTAYNYTFNIGGNGWLGASPQTGALRVYGCTVNGPINLTDNARIGGTINGATLQGVISGPYQLEVWGTTNSFVLVMGPTNGSPQSYGSTLITAGAIKAANSNAISSGALTLDVGGDLQLNGYNLTVANLSSINSGNVQLLGGATVRNMNTTNSAVLTVGTDGSSTEFDGSFSDGSTASFGLTKVGTGTLTITGVNSNTGPVKVLGGSLALSGSGIFNKAAQILTGTGGTYDVTAAGSTLTLNSGQTVGGNGTIKGSLAVPAGSIVAPGLPLGTLTVSGSATVSGTYRSNLNRTNANNCSQFTASGGVTFSGATLTVTNVGSKLQVGDTFQLFPTGTSGFSTYVLQSSDTANNAVYTWNNTIGTDGKITVASVNYLVNPNPTNITTSVSGQTLTLQWPSDHTGWTLQAQTNALGIGLSTNWFTMAGSSATNQVNIPVVVTNAAVFYRLVYTNTP